MKKIFLPLMLIVFMMTGCGGVDIMDKLTVGIDDGYPPVGFRDENGEIVGFDIDLAKETANRMGVKFEFKPIDWNLKEEELNSGRIDMIWNGLDITPEREEKFLYSKPYMNNRQILLIKKGNVFNIHSEYDLAGKIVGMRAGSTAEVYINRNEDLKKSLADFKTYDTFQAAFDDLVSDKFDVLVIDELVGRYERIKNIDKLDVIDVTIGPVTEIGIGFRKNDIELRDKVQLAFDDIVKNGTAKKISEQWFDSDLLSQ